MCFTHTANTHSYIYIYNTLCHTTSRTGLVGIKLSSSSVQAGQSMMYSTSLCLSGRNISSCYCFITFNFADIRNLFEGNVRWVVQICCPPSWEWKDPPVKGIKVKEEVAHTHAQRTALEIDPRAHPPKMSKENERYA